MQILAGKAAGAFKRLCSLCHATKIQEAQMARLHSAQKTASALSTAAGGSMCSCLLSRTSRSARSSARCNKTQPQLLQQSQRQQKRRKQHAPSRFQMQERKPAAFNTTNNMGTAVTTATLRAEPGHTLPLFLSIIAASTSSSCQHKIMHGTTAISRHSNLRCLQSVTRRLGDQGIGTRRHGAHVTPKGFLSVEWDGCCTVVDIQRCGERGTALRGGHEATNAW